MMKKGCRKARLVLFGGFLFAGLSLGLAGSVAAQSSPQESSGGSSPAPPPGSGLLLEAPIVLDGVGVMEVASGLRLRTGFIELQPERKLGEGEAPSLVLDTSPVVLDGWTAFRGDTDGGQFETFENENYLFPRPTVGNGTITFCLAIKVPRGGIPAGIAADFVVIPSTQRVGNQNSDMPPAPPVSLFVDDIQFGNPGAGTLARQVIAFVDIERIEDALGGAGTFDWMAIVDFAANQSSDDDGNNAPDVALETSMGSVQLKLTNSIDQVGADVVDFFTGNANRVNVFEARGSIPAPRSGFPGMQTGEDGTTRPWAFVLQ